MRKRLSLEKNPEEDTSKENVKEEVEAVTSRWSLSSLNNKIGLPSFTFNKEEKSKDEI